MAFTLEQTANNIVTTAAAAITATFGTAIQVGETVGVVATYIGTLGTGTCADGLSNAFVQGATVAGIGWTKTTFYYINHPGGTSTVTFTAPASILNKGIVAYRISATGTIEFADSICTTQAAPGTVVDAVTTGAMAVNSDAIILGENNNQTKPNQTSPAYAGFFYPQELKLWIH